MKKIYPPILMILFLCLTLPAPGAVEGADRPDRLGSAAAYIHHELTVTVDPAGRHIQAVDIITIPGGIFAGPAEFLLYEGLEPVLKSDDASLTLVEEGLSGIDSGMDREEQAGEDIIRQNRYRVEFSGKPGKEITIALSYGGDIYFPVEATGREYARGFSQTPGLICEAGVYLAGSTFWVPDFEKGLITFDMIVRLPAGWSSVSQGSRIAHGRTGDEAPATHGEMTGAPAGDDTVSRWLSREPMEEIFLIAAKFTEYSIKAGDIDVMAFLRTPDEPLASRYLETTGQYLEMYRNIIGEYPFSKFALVENFWETGYGMPSFTLLGEKVIRFPFILHSSYPHELLHNYWGNSVYVDFDGGNWCEGLTAYMADHLIKEQRGQGDEYRRDALRKYTDYVRAGNDFPLKEFISRHDAASEAVGYGKSMMMWNMLRCQVGDETFIEGVRKFYADNIFRDASFEDIRRSFEAVSARGLVTFFRQWVDRTGAPELQLVDVTAKPYGTGPAAGGSSMVNGNGSMADGGSGSRPGHGFAGESGFVMDITIEQVQDEAPYTLELPVAVSFADSVVIRTVVMYGKMEMFSLGFREEPLHVQVDPHFDIFRRLHHNEIPPALSGAYGAEKITIVLPSASGSSGSPGQAEPSALAGAYRDIASAWAEDETIDAEIVMDDELSSLPGDRVVWVFGRMNRFRELIDRGLEGREASISGDGVKLGNNDLGWGDKSIIVAVRHPKDPTSVMAWLTLGSPGAAPGLLRKLPHYGKYGYLAFEGDEPDNIVKGQWEAIASPMAADVNPPGGKIRPGSVADAEQRHTNAVEQTAASRADTDQMMVVPYTGIDKLPKRKPLAMLAPLFSQERMMKDIEYLSSAELEGREPGTDGAEKAAEYIAARFKEAGLSPGGDDGTFFQRWQDTAGAEGATATLTNVIGVLPGSPAAHGRGSGETGSSPRAAVRTSAVLCAHYDHLGRGWPDVHAGDEGKIHPGADDNASGVAVMIELARHFSRNVKPPRNIVFAAFTAEESGLRGSKRFIESMSAGPVSKASSSSDNAPPSYPASACIGAINLDTVGRLGGRKILVLGASSAREWRFIFIGGSYVTGIESEVVTHDLDASDDRSFVDAGIPAVQLFAGPHEDYHRPSDTADRIDPEGLVKTASLAREALLYLADREEPLDFTGKRPAAAGHPGAAAGSGGHPGGTIDDRSAEGEGHPGQDGTGRPGGGPRRVGTGCMPDFAFSGKGVRVASVSDGSPADAAGIKAGDVIIRIGDHDVAGLKEYSAALKNFDPGDETTIVIIRDGSRIEKTIVLKER